MGKLMRNGSIVALACLWAFGAQAQSPQTRSLAERVEAEIVELHEFLEAWSNAELKETDQAFGRFADVIGSRFLIIDPRASQTDEAGVEAAIRSAYGRWRDEPGRILIKNVQLRYQADGLALATYEEWHEFPSRNVAILSSVLLGEREGLPNDLEWLHLHEVWLQTEEAKSP